MLLNKDSACGFYCSMDIHFAKYAVISGNWVFLVSCGRKKMAYTSVVITTAISLAARIRFSGLLCPK